MRMRQNNQNQKESSGYYDFNGRICGCGMFLYVWRSRLGTKYRANQCFLAPVMMQNPEPFSSLSQASEYDFASFRMEGGDTKSGKL